MPPLQGEIDRSTANTIMFLGARVMDNSVFDDKEFCKIEIEPHQARHGMPLAVKDLSYTVVSNKNKKASVMLLKNITVGFTPAELCALMGASGSGKSTLLDVLAGRKTTGEITGSVLYSSQKATKKFLRRYTGYVEQFDTMLDMLTVKEMLMYTAELKRPHTESYAEKEAAVDFLISRLALSACQDTKIGNPMVKGISGGQAKRTSIAMAMVTRPRVLFLDEPTSGLDSFTANETMKLVKQLAVSEGVTMLAAIHSPAPFTFELFDSVVLLVSGEVVYFGANDQAMLEYFKGGCGIPPVTSMTDVSNVHNPAEFLTDLIVGATQRDMGHQYAEAYRKSEQKQRMEAFVNDLQRKDSMKIPPAVKEALETGRATVTPCWWGLRTMVKYRTGHNYRRIEFLGPRIADKIVFSLIIMGLYWNVASDYSQPNISNINAMLFMWTVLPSFGAASFVPSIVLERPLFVRERNDGLYRVITYLVAKMVDELLLATVASLIFAAIVWFPLGLKGSFLYFWLLYLEVLAIGIMLAYLIASNCPNIDAANTALPGYVITLLFFAGLLMRFVDIPSYMRWYSRIDFMRYSWGALMKNEYGGRDPPYAGTTVLQTFGLTDISVPQNLAILLVFFVTFFALTLVTLSYRRFGAK